MREKRKTWKNFQIITTSVEHPYTLPPPKKEKKKRKKKNNFLTIPPPPREAANKRCWDGGTSDVGWRSKSSPSLHLQCEMKLFYITLHFLHYAFENRDEAFLNYITFLHRSVMIIPPMWDEAPQQTNGELFHLMLNYYYCLKPWHEYDIVIIIIYLMLDNIWNDKKRLYKMLKFHLENGNMVTLLLCFSLCILYVFLSFTLYQRFVFSVLLCDNL